MSCTGHDSGSNLLDRSDDMWTRRRLLKGVAGFTMIAIKEAVLNGESLAASVSQQGRTFDLTTAERMMRRAIELSRQGMRAREGGPFGAVIVNGGAIVGEGWNRVLVTNDPTAHAEMEAIRAAARSLGSFTLKGCELYTSAQPCPMCLGAIYWSRLDRVFYGNSVKDTAAIGFDDEVFYRQLTSSPQQRDIPEVQVLADEAQHVFREYEAKPGTIRY